MTSLVQRSTKTLDIRVLWTHLISSSHGTSCVLNRNQMVTVSWDQRRVNRLPRGFKVSSSLKWRPVQLAGAWNLCAIELTISALESSEVGMMLLPRSSLVEYISSREINEFIKYFLLCKSWQEYLSLHSWMCLCATDATRVPILAVELSLLFQIPGFDPIGFSRSCGILLPRDHHIVEVFGNLFIYILVLSVILFQIENDFLDCFVYLSSSYVWLVQRELLRGWNVGHAERLSSFLWHIKVGYTSMGFDLFHAYQFSILFVLADQVYSFGRMDVLQPWRIRVFGTQANTTSLLNLNARSQPRECLLLFLLQSWINCSCPNTSTSTFWRYNIFSSSFISLRKRSSNFIFCFHTLRIHIISLRQIIFLRTLLKLTILKQLKPRLSFIDVLI